MLPGGTLNHFARDTGTGSLKEAVAAATNGEAAQADVGIVTVERGLAGNPETAELIMVNTASVGLYPNLVRRREQLQPALGKTIGRSGGHVPDLRGGNAHHPDRGRGAAQGLDRCTWGAAATTPGTTRPLFRPVLDDGVLDVRMITADESFARLRLLWSVLTGTVATSRITHLREATEVLIESAGSPMALAVDGEALAGVRSARIRVEPRALTYYSPRP